MNANPYPQGSAKYAAFDRILRMTAEEAAAFVRFLEELAEQERSCTHA